MGRRKSCGMLFRDRMPTISLSVGYFITRGSSFFNGSASDLKLKTKGLRRHCNSSNSVLHFYSNTILLHLFED